MVQFQKDAALGGIPFGVLEVVYPDKPLRRTEDFRIMVEEHLRLLRRNTPTMTAKALFGEKRLFPVFQEIQKTYPVMMQLESFLLKGRPFPIENAVTAIPFLAELETQSLSGTHDVDFVRGAVRLFAGTEKAPFPGMRGVRRYIPTPATSARETTRASFFSMIAGADARTCVKRDEPACVLPRVRRGRTAGGGDIRRARPAGRIRPCSRAEGGDRAATAMKIAEIRYAGEFLSPAVL